jgi:transglutaminase-like putative cysteine protease
MNLLVDIGLPVLVHYLRKNESGGALGSPVVRSLANRIDLDGLIADLKAPENQLIDVSYKTVKSLDERVKEIIKLVNAAAVDPSVHALALKITKGCFDNTICQIRKIEGYMRSTFDYSQEVGEILTDPRLLFDGSFEGGDCDDLSAAVCALAESLRIPCQLRVTGESKTEPTHIFPLLSTDKDNPDAPFVAMDLTLKEPLGYDLSKNGDQVKVKDYGI